MKYYDYSYYYNILSNSSIKYNMLTIYTYNNKYKNLTNHIKKKVNNILMLSICKSIS